MGNCSTAEDAIDDGTQEPCCDWSSRHAATEDMFRMEFSAGRHPAVHLTPTRPRGTVPVKLNSTTEGFEFASP